MRLVLVALGLSCAAAPAAAQPALVPAGDKVVIPLTVSPAAVPKPVSRFLLRPQYTETLPGERLAGFLKSFMEQNVFFNAENAKKRHEWNELPVGQLPLDEIKEHGVLDGIAYDPPYARLMVFLDQAARYDRVEWNIWYNLRRDGAYTLLPEVQKLRELASVLKLRMRAEIKAGEFAKAAETSKTLFGLARTLEQHPTLIGYLVGVAVASITVEALEEMVQQPGCPNLYWGLTELGSPVLDIRLAAQGERTFLTEQLRQLVDATGPVSDAELAKHLKVLDGLLTIEQGRKKGDPNPATSQFKDRAADAQFVANARAALVEYGAKPEVVKAFTPLQTVLLYDLRKYEVYRDDALKLIPLPHWQFEPLAAAADEALGREKDKGDLILAPTLVPAIRKVRAAQTRLDQRVSFLRVIEAVRLHAHENGGKLPGSLDEVKLPLPVDPVNGMRFSYGVRDGEVAVLNGANPNPGQAVTNRHYEIRVRE